MQDLHLNHFKEDLPDNTIKKLKKILEENNLETNENLFKKSDIDTYSCRITLSGTNIGTNGKGMTKEYALASGYGEFFERYQNNFLLMDLIGKNSTFDFFYSPDEKFIPLEQLIDERNVFIEMLIDNLKLKTSSKKKKIKAITELNYFDRSYKNLDTQVLCIPYYSVKNKDVIYIPLNLSRLAYGSNGMCAGNKPEEALVQGLSEIFERVVQKNIFINCPNLPTIPTNIIKNQYPSLRNAIEKLESEKDVYFEFKDCTLNGKYPVAGLLIGKINTGKYGFKLGCHPIYEIALERTLTEATQGQNIKDYAMQNDILFNYKFNENELYNSYKVGKGNYPHKIFSNNGKFCNFENFKCEDNKSLLIKWIDKILEWGYDVLIRDCSVLGFPTFQIIIPNLSELINLNKERMHAINSKYYCSNLITYKLDSLTKEDANLCLATMNYFLNSLLDNNMKSFCGLVDEKDIPYEQYGFGLLYFMMMCHIFLDEYNEAYKKIIVMIKILKNLKNVQQKDYDLLICLKYFLLLNQEQDETKKKEISDIINKMFSKEILAKVETIFENKFKIFSSQYINLSDKNSFDIDKYEKIMKDYKKLLTPYKKALKKSMINQKNIESFFIKEESHDR